MVLDDPQILHDMQRFYVRVAAVISGGLIVFGNPLTWAQTALLGGLTFSVMSLGG